MSENEMILCEGESVEVEAVNLEELVEPDELTCLKQEIDTLKEELKKRDELDRANARINNEVLEFKEYFPDVDVHTIPSDVWEKVRAGSSLAGSYALMLKKDELEKKKIGDFNEKNRRMSAGSLISGEGEKYYSPAEVKKMTPTQVRAHYDDIMASMKHWN